MRQRPMGVPAIVIASALLMTGLMSGCGGDGGDADDEANAAPSPRVVITVGNGREVEVNGRKLGPGEHPGRPAPNPPAGRTKMILGPPGQVTPVTIGSAAKDDDKDKIVLIHIDASAEDGTILLYGTYESDIAAMSESAALGLPDAETATSEANIYALSGPKVVASGWECKWCQGDILACGVNPQCPPRAGRGAIP